MIEVQVDAGTHPELEDLLRSAVEATLSQAEIDAGEVSITLLDDAAIQAMNREHLKHDRVTDVISFALWEEGEPVVGDIYLGADQAGRQAAEADVDVHEEFTRLAVHGTLHVLGWDHPEAAEERVESEMYRLQETIVAALARGER